VQSPVTFEPIGVVRSPFREKVEAPRQARAAAETEATIELFPGRDFEHALEDLTCWDRIWVIFLFDRAGEWRPKVLPPRSERRRGVFATRSPHRPNPIGMSAVKLLGVEGLTVRVREVDMIDGTPVLDLKPYVPYADAFPDAGSGWLDSTKTGPISDPVPAYTVAWTDEARAQAAWLAARAVDLVRPVEQALALGPRPNAYRRIRERRNGERAQLELAVKDWRVAFDADGGTITVRTIRTGYRPRELATGTAPELEIPRAFVAAFGHSS
jgi:tRNA-Thr(GGU) m(6)t(6)A37 methyltransferase TsaA